MTKTTLHIDQGPFLLAVHLTNLINSLRMLKLLELFLTPPEIPNLFLPTQLQCLLSVVLTDSLRHRNMQKKRHLLYLPPLAMFPLPVCTQKGEWQRPLMGFPIFLPCTSPLTIPLVPRAVLLLEAPSVVDQLPVLAAEVLLLVKGFKTPIC